MNTSIQEGVKCSSIDIEGLKRAGKVFRENEGASIIDTGARIALLEFHKNNRMLRN